MALQCGIVGLPNVGKSTLFNAITSAKAEAANYPFCTIDPNVGVVTVPDPRLDKIGKLVHTKVSIPTTIEFVDIAGIVEGASKGEGLGNQFLANIRETDAILHVVRCFEDPNVVHVAGSVNPTRDMDVINTELMLADLESMEKRLDRLKKQTKGTADQKLKEELSLVERVHKALSDGRPARSVDLKDDEIPLLKTLHLLTAKPVLYVCNVSEEDFSKNGNEFVKQVEERAKAENNKTIMISCALEAEIAQLSPDERKDFLASIGAEEPGLNRLIREAYALLNLITYFTAGEKETRAWTIIRGWRAPQAASVIHTDFEKGFIRAETYACEDLFRLGSEAAVKDAGLYRSEGKEYVVKDGDILFFKFNV